jgi:nucleoside-diphosphate-sugar epimerase
VRVLLTGGTSLLGATTARLLVERGDEVTLLQRRPSGLPCREVLGDVADPASTAPAAEGQDAVLHLAAKVDVTGPWTEYERTNVEGTRAVVAACRAAGVGRLVHVSSPAVAHGGAALVGAGAGPADPVAARGGYARSKALAERVALAADGPALAVLAVRPHLVWGPGDTQLVGRIVERARTGRLALVGTGAALIDTTYLDDAAAALVAAVDACGPVHGEALVVSSGEPRPVAEVVGRLCAAAGAPGPRHRVPFPVAWVAGGLVEAVWGVTGRRDTPPLTRFLAEQLATAHWFDQRRTREALGWAPAVPLDEGFARLAEWYAAAALSPGREPGARAPRAASTPGGPPARR